MDELDLGEAERTAKAPRTRGSTIAGQRNASWSGATGRPYQADLSSPGTYHHQQRGAEAVGRLSSSTSARFPGYAASSAANAPSGQRMGQRNTSGSGVPYNTFQGLGSPGGRSGAGRFSLSQGGGLVGGPSSAGGTGASQFLLTVVPPMHLPHDPPHPRTSQACSGYGPPEYFRCVLHFSFCPATVALPHPHSHPRLFALARVESADASKSLIDAFFLLYSP